MAPTSTTEIIHAPQTAAIDSRAFFAAFNMNVDDPKAAALVAVCIKYNLDPILKHAVLIQGTLYVTRDGLMHVAHASGLFDGIEVAIADETATHFIAVATVWRKDMTRGFTFRGRFPKNKPMAKDFGPEMAEKVAGVPRAAPCFRRVYVQPGRTLGKRGRRVQCAADTRRAQNGNREPPYFCVGTTKQ